MGNRLRFIIDGVECHAVLRDHALADSVSAMCPFEARYSRGGNHEYYAALPQKAAAKGCASTTRGKKNGLYYFEGWNALSLVFKDCDTTPYQIHEIGGFEEDVSAVLERSAGSIRIRCEAE